MMSAHAANPPDATRPGWYSPNHKPGKLSAEPPVTSAQTLWRLVKDGHVAEARVRPIEGIGVELRFEWDGDLRVSQVFKAGRHSKPQQRRNARSWKREAGSRRNNPAGSTGRERVEIDLPPHLTRDRWTRAKSVDASRRNQSVNRPVASTSIRTVVTQN